MESCPNNADTRLTIDVDSLTPAPREKRFGNDGGRFGGYGSTGRVGCGIGSGIGIGEWTPPSTDPSSSPNPSRHSIPGKRPKPFFRRGNRFFRCWRG